MQQMHLRDISLVKVVKRRSWSNAFKCFCTVRIDSNRLMVEKRYGAYYPQSYIQYGEGLPAVHYLPAIRGGIMQSHRTLVSALIRGATREGIKPGKGRIFRYSMACWRILWRR